MATYTITPNKTWIKKGESVTYTISTTDVPDGTVLTWVTTGVIINNGTLNNDPSGNVTITSGLASFNVNTISYGGEYANGLYPSSISNVPKISINVYTGATVYTQSDYITESGNSNTQIIQAIYESYSSTGVMATGSYGTLYGLARKPEYSGISYWYKYFVETYGPTVSYSLTDFQKFIVESTFISGEWVRTILPNKPFYDAPFGSYVTPRIIGTQVIFDDSVYASDYAPAGYYDSNGLDICSKYVTREYLNDHYPDLIPQYNQGILYATGSNASGLLGNGTTTTTTSFTAGGYGISWKEISMSGNHALGIRSDGTLYSWGNNNYGQLGTGATTARSSPGTVVGGGTNWKQVSAGGNAPSAAGAISAAIKTDGTLWTWGRNNYGQLGDGSITNRSSPVTVAGGGTNWKQVAVGNYHCAAVKTDGTLWTWGRNDWGQLGLNDNTSRSSPETVAGGGTNWKQVSCTITGEEGSVAVGVGAVTAAVKTDGTLWTWGRADQGALGSGSTLSRSSPGQIVGQQYGWNSVDCGKSRSMIVAAIKTDGTLWTWGVGGDTSLGDGTAATRSSPVTTVAGGNDWKQVSAGSYTFGAIKTNGELWMWGRCNSYELGLVDSNTPLVSPMMVPGYGTNWKQVQCGYNQSFAIIDSNL